MMRSLVEDALAREETAGASMAQAAALGADQRVDVIFSDRLGGVECSVCGGRVELEDQFCPSCGSRFADKPRLEGKVERKVRR